MCRAEGFLGCPGFVLAGGEDEHHGEMPPDPRGDLSPLLPGDISSCRSSAGKKKINKTKPKQFCLAGNGKKELGLGF